jgi:acyl-CoA synthetase (AMP-forming)/AMP-acid ligase II/aryl carrier-like protein
MRVLAKKLMIFGGDSFSVNVLDRLVKLKYAGQVYNHYGPTEATIGKTIHRVDLKKSYTNIPIGKPFSNTSVYILNKSMQPVPVAVPGELYIAGEGLARGYLNNPQLTAEKFIPNPFSDIDGERMYKTGDLARWLTDGNIEYLGRVDEQIKIRGFRIEPGEIEDVLKESGLIQQVVVLTAKAGGTNKVLVAYVVPKSNFDKASLVSFLQQKVPDYMIPSVWVPMLQMPLTSNGKIDRKSLPAPDAQLKSGNDYIAPRSPLEQVLADTWQELLGIDKIGIHDNFFESGGDSIISIQVVSRVRRKGYDFQVADIFTHQTIAKLSALVEQRSQQSLQFLGEQGY